MSSDDFTIPPKEERLTAVQLRDQIADQLMAKAKKAAEDERKKDDELKKAHDDFMSRKLTDADRQRYRTMVESAVKQGLFEIELIRFPAEYLPDHGRRINNNEPDWHDSLVGFARELYGRFEMLEMKESGFHFIARVLNYPQGFIGDIGLYVSWK